MKVAYLFESEHAREILENMIIPQLEEDRHGVEVAGMMFFFDNAYMLVEGSDIAARLQALSEKTGMLLMACDRCCYQRDIADKLIAPAGIGCFPNVYAALAPAGVDQVITLKLFRKVKRGKRNRINGMMTVDPFCMHFKKFSIKWGSLTEF